MRARSERGNTMIELLAATIIIGIISFALTESLVSGLNNTGETQVRLTGSIDRQRVASAFVPDAQSAQEMVSVTPCVGAVPSPDVVGNLQWTDGTDHYVASYLDIDAELVRRLCKGPDPGNVEPVGDDETLAELGPDFEVSMESQGSKIALKVCVSGDPECKRPGFMVLAAKRAVPTP